jgi:hypothetical protein
LYPFFTFFFLFETILMADTSMCTHALTHTLASGFHNGYLMHTKKQNKLHFIWTVKPPRVVLLSSWEYF